MVLRELRPHFNREPQSIARVLVNERIYAEGRSILTVDSVVHDQEFAIGRINRHRLHRFEVTRIHALVEVAIVESHTSLLTTCLSTDSQIVVQDETQLRIANEVALHLNHSVDCRIYDHAIGVVQDGQLLEDVDENLIRLRLFRI